MAEDTTDQQEPETSAEAETSVAEQAGSTGADTSAPPGAAEERQESGTKGMLREAIQKVMDAIEHHEREARMHLQQAAALRKELRESFAFVHEGGAKGKFLPAAESKAAKAAEPDAAASQDAEPARRLRRVRRKKKRGAARGKEEK